jgi:hypothetical protein
MDSVYLNFLSLFFCIAFLIITYINENLGLKIIVLTLSVLLPFKNNYLPIGLPGIFIIIFTIISSIKENKSIYSINNLVAYSRKFVFLYYLLIAGFFIGFYNTAIGKDFTEGHYSNFNQMFVISLQIISIILFIKILLTYRFDFKFQSELLRWFGFSILFHLVTYLISKNSTLTSIFFFHSEYDSDLINLDVNRFMSLIGDYELTIDYVLINSCFLLLLKNRFKDYWLHLLLIPLSIWIGLTTGTRSFIVIGLVFFVLFVLFVAKRKILFLSGFMVTFFLFFNSDLLAKYLSQSVVFSRFNKTLEQFENDQSITKLSGRDFSQAISDLLPEASIMGFGSFIISKFNENEMVSHNLFLAMYAKYGIPGLVMLLSLFIYLFKTLAKTIKTSKTSSIQFEAKLLLITLCCLMFQQYKISGLRNISVMLIYTFFFFNIYCIYLKNLTRHQWKP